MNLLDLPEEILIKILSYCAGDGKQRYLVKTTEVCKYFNDLVANNSCLMEQIQLKVHVIYGHYHNRVKKSFKFCLGSSRKYTSIDIFLDSEFIELLNDDEKHYLEILLYKHAATIKDVKFKIASRRDYLNDTVLYYLGFLPHIERAVITIKYIYDKYYSYQKHSKRFQECYDFTDSDFEDGEEDSFQIPAPTVLFMDGLCWFYRKKAMDVKFNNLRNLKLCVHIEDGVKSIDFPSPAKWLNRVDPSVFQSLQLNYFGDFLEHHKAQIVQNLVDSSNRLDLKSFELNLSINEDQKALLSEFLQTQRNLIELKVCNNSWVPSLDVCMLLCVSKY